MARGTDVTRAVLEAVAIEAYRSGAITPGAGTGDAWSALTLGNETFLHGANTYHGYTVDDLDREIAAIRNASR